MLRIELGEIIYRYFASCLLCFYIEKSVKEKNGHSFNAVPFHKISKGVLLFYVCVFFVYFTFCHQLPNLAFSRAM